MVQFSNIRGPWVFRAFRRCSTETWPLLLPPPATMCNKKTRNHGRLNPKPFHWNRFHPSSSGLFIARRTASSPAPVALTCHARHLHRRLLMHMRLRASADCPGLESHRKIARSSKNANQWQCCRRRLVASQHHCETTRQHARSRAARRLPHGLRRRNRSSCNVRKVFWNYFTVLRVAQCWRLASFWHVILA